MKSNIGTCSMQDYMDKEHTVTDYTDNGKCSSCGACCSNYIPVSIAEIRRIKDYIQKNNIKERRALIPTIEATIDCTCPFLDPDKELKCRIYEVRPQVCRMFICSKPNKTKMHVMPIDMRGTFYGR